MFDPLGLKPKDAAGLEAMQAKEINNGRLAMIAMAGMVVQELVTGNKLFSVPELLCPFRSAEPRQPL